MGWQKQLFLTNEYIRGPAHVGSESDSDLESALLAKYVYTFKGFYFANLFWSLDA